jgi:anti-anti-sigma factor
MTATTLTFGTASQADGRPVLTVAGEIDMSNAGALGAALRAALPEQGSLVVDLTAVEYLDTAGLAELFPHADAIEIVVTSLLTPVLTISGLAAMTTIRQADQPS